MGGCRCTYRNCTVKTDGKTHLFHYPVFEKVRCHKWLVNAHRLDFLNLKVSQLKNRVICQHHFKDDNFMNYKKDKLTFNAIPTEDGPFCDSSNYVDPTCDVMRSYNNMILLEDIENEVIFDDKKANFAMKYGDFLTNGESMNSSIKSEFNNVKLSKENSKINLNPNIIINCTDELSKPQVEPIKPRFTRLSLNTKMLKKVPNPQPMLIVPPYNDLSYEIAVGKEIIQEQGNINISQLNTVTYPTNSGSIKSENEVNNEMASYVKKEPKIKILSEERIEGPIPVPRKLEKVSPSTTIIIPEKKMEVVNINKEKPKQSIMNEVKVTDIIDIEYDPVQTKSDTSMITPSNTETKIIKTEVPKQQLKVKIKNKLTPERTAAIEKKRRFNMRMKDLLETCLDKLEEPVISNEKSASNKTSSKSLIKQPNLQVSAHLAKEETLPSVQDYTIAYLDERLKSMEKVLLNKIEHNSQKIMELTESCGNQKKRKKLIQNKNVYVQTNENEEQYKRFLYQELCKYISQDSKSLIYEELFINKFALVDSTLQRKKRRKCI